MKMLSTAAALLLSAGVVHAQTPPSSQVPPTGQTPPVQLLYADASEHYLLAVLRAMWSRIGQQVRVATPRAQIRAKALVTRRMRPFRIDGKVVHQVGMPWHWGYEGVVTGDVVNELTALVGDPNVSIHEGKAFVCSVEKA